MIVNSGGENIAPSRVEAEFIAEPEIAQIMVYGDSRPHLVALIVPSVELREEPKAAQRQNISKLFDGQIHAFLALNVYAIFI